MNKILISGIAVSIITGVLSVFVWQEYSANRDTKIWANNTPSFQWDRGEDADELVLYVSPQIKSSRMATAPSVPVEANKVSIKGEPGTVAPKALVQVTNQRTGEQMSTTAAKDGSFEIVTEAKEGDEFKVFALPVPAILSAPPSHFSAQPLSGQAIQAQ